MCAGSSVKLSTNACFRVTSAVGIRASNSPRLQLKIFRERHSGIAALNVRTRDRRRDRVLFSTNLICGGPLKSITILAVGRNLDLSIP